MKHRKYVYCADLFAIAPTLTPFSSLAEYICLLCRKNPTDRVSAYCGRACRDTALDKGPLVLKVPIDHDRFRSGEYSP